jgi:endonuclease-3
MQKRNSKLALPAKQKAIAAARRVKRPKIPYTAEEIYEIFRRFSVQRPEPRSELDYTNAFTMLVAVVLSAQATDAGVNKATKKLFEIADTPERWRRSAKAASPTISARSACGAPRRRTCWRSRRR